MISFILLYDLWSLNSYSDSFFFFLPHKGNTAQKLKDLIIFDPIYFSEFNLP